MGISLGDLYEAYNAIDASIDRVVEFWLTVTFATIVATFIAQRQISKGMYWLVTFLYGMASVALMLRFYWAFVKAGDLHRQLVDAGEWLPTGMLFLLTPVLTASMMFVGTFGTLFFVWHTYRNKVE